MTRRPVAGRLTAVGAETYRYLDLVRPGSYEYAVRTISCSGAREVHAAADTMSVTVRREDLAATLAEPGGIDLLLGLTADLARGGRDVVDDWRAFATASLRRRQLGKLACATASSLAVPDHGWTTPRPGGSQPWHKRIPAKGPPAGVRIVASAADARAFETGGAIPSAGEARILTRGDGGVRSASELAGGSGGGGGADVIGEARAFLDSLVELGLMERADRPRAEADVYPQEVELGPSSAPPAVRATEPVETLAGPSCSQADFNCTTPSA